MVQRKLAGLERLIDRRAFVDRVGNRLAARQHAFAPGLLRRMMHQTVVMAAGYYLHAAALRRAFRERHPGRDLLFRLEAEIGSVLVPADISVIARVLEPHRQRINQDVRPDQGFHRVQDGGMARDFVHPGEHEV